MVNRLALMTAFVAALFAVHASAQESKQRLGDADKRSDAGSEVFGGADASKSQAQKESERGAASRSYSSGGADPRKMPTSPRGGSIVGGPRGGGGGARF
jgi:hypothetical protein